MIEITKNNAETLKNRNISKIESTNLTAEISEKNVKSIQYFEVHGDNVLFFVYDNEDNLTTYGADTWAVTTM